MRQVTFDSDGWTLKGNLYYPENYEEGRAYPAVIVAGSWTTVKEQMAATYAERLSKEGFITLAFDFRNFGESEGEPRFYENPELKAQDIKNAVTFLQSQPEVDADNIGALGICAGAMHTVFAASEDPRIRSIATVASWLHDAEAVKLFYGGAEGVQERLDAAAAAKKKYAETGEVDYVPTISDSDPTAAMFGPYDYYLNAERGAIPEWSHDKFAVMSWEDWLLANPMTRAQHITQPMLMVHSDGAVLPDYTKKFFDDLGSEMKELHWMTTDLDSPFHQFSYYDQADEVNEAVEQASSWFTRTLHNEVTVGG